MDGRKGEIEASRHSAEVLHHFSRTVHAVIVEDDADFEILCVSVINGFEKVKIIYDIIRDWETVSYLVRSKLRLRRVNNGNFKIKNI